MGQTMKTKKVVIVRSQLIEAKLTECRETVYLKQFSCGVETIVIFLLKVPRGSRYGSIALNKSRVTDGQH